MSQDPTSWFDQFNIDDLKAAGVAGSDLWCIQHWAPAPVFQADGIKASLMLISEAYAAGVTGIGIGPLCCRVGDVAMYRIWGKCPPSETRPA